MFFVYCVCVSIVLVGMCWFCLCNMCVKWIGGMLIVVGLCLYCVVFMYVIWWVYWFWILWLCSDGIVVWNFYSVCRGVVCGGVLLCVVCCLCVDYWFLCYGVCVDWYYEWLWFFDWWCYCIYLWVGFFDCCDCWCGW